MNIHFSSLVCVCVVLSCVQGQVPYLFSMYSAVWAAN